MTNDEIEKQLKKFDDLSAEFKDIPSALKELQRKKEVFLKANPVIVPSDKCRKKLEEFLTRNERMLELKKHVMTLAPHNDSVLIMGESGTGKDILGKSLHGEREGAFIRINCAGMPEHLIESELFGHKRGAFTGAENEKDGIFKICNEGTIFLDEIGELSLPLQAKLLVVLQDGEYRRVGSNVVERSTARIVSATNHDLTKLVGAKLFRLDLYARLSTFELVTLPIRERREDIELIVNAMDDSRHLIYYALKNYLDTQEFSLNVRDIQRIVRRYQMFGRVI